MQLLTHALRLTLQKITAFKLRHVLVITSPWVTWIADLNIFPDSKVHGAHLGPVGPRWALCWPHEPCYRVIYIFFSNKQRPSPLWNERRFHGRECYVLMLCWYMCRPYLFNCSPKKVFTMGLIHFHWCHLFEIMHIINLVKLTIKNLFGLVFIG